MEHVEQGLGGSDKQADMGPRHVILACEVTYLGHKEGKGKPALRDGGLLLNGPFHEEMLDKDHGRHRRVAVATAAPFKCHLTTQKTTQGGAGTGHPAACPGLQSAFPGAEAEQTLPALLLLPGGHVPTLPAGVLAAHFRPQNGRSRSHWGHPCCWAEGLCGRGPTRRVDGLADDGRVSAHPTEERAAAGPGSPVQMGSAASRRSAHAGSAGRSSPREGMTSRRAVPSCPGDLLVIHCHISPARPRPW